MASQYPETPLEKREELFVPFLSAEKPHDEYRIGPEMEKFGVLSGGRPIGYDGPTGVSRFMEMLAKEHGWMPEGEGPGGPTIALLRNHASITLEPGSQFELSGAAHEDVHQVFSEAVRHHSEIAPLSKELGVRWLGVGFHPFAKRADYTFVPKMRYGIMREYLPTRGEHALDMMLRTATVQANFDYSSEKDAMQKMRVALRLSPMNTALFANSPFYEGKVHGGKTYRGKVWLDVDPDRSGLVPSLLEPDASYEKYVEWALDVPMFMLKREGKPIKNTGQTFRSFWKEGFEGYSATQNDWQTHLNTLFPEVRLKKTLEIRGADSQDTPLMAALAALWTGILYDEEALHACDELTADWNHDELMALRPAAAHGGLEATFRGKPLAAYAERVISISKSGLMRRKRIDANGKDESKFLEPLEKLAASAKSPADDLLARAKANAKGGDLDPASIIAAAEITT